MSVNRVPQLTDSGDGAGSKAPFVGPLTPHLEGFAAHLGVRAIPTAVLHTKCALARELNRWLARHNFAVVDFDEARLCVFIAGRRRRLGGHVRRRDGPTGRQLLGYLRGLGCVPGPAPILDRTALGKLTRDFETFLRSQRGLAPTTVSAYVDCTRRLLTDRFRGRALCLQHLQARDIDRFILREARRVSRISVKKTLAALRCFLRYALQRGAINTDLAMGLPKVAVWRFSDVPKSLPPDQVERLLGSCDRSTAAGQRNHAILLLSARLGLRAGEVGALSLEDLDWDHGEIVVHAKRQRIERLPLPKDAGAALAATHATLDHTASRAQSSLDSKRHGAAFLPLGIGQIVRRALKRAGLKPERTGAHLLHTLWRPTCCARAPLYARSMNCSATMTPQRRRSTPRSISKHCVRSPARGWDVRRERSQDAASGVSDSTPRARLQAVLARTPAAAFHRVRRARRRHAYHQRSCREVGNGASCFAILVGKTPQRGARLRQALQLSRSAHARATTSLPALTVGDRRICTGTKTSVVYSRLRASCPRRWACALTLSRRSSVCMWPLGCASRKPCASIVLTWTSRTAC